MARHRPPRKQRPSPPKQLVTKELDHMRRHSNQHAEDDFLQLSSPKEERKITLPSEHVGIPEGLPTAIGSSLFAGFGTFPAYCYARSIR